LDVVVEPVEDTLDFVDVTVEEVRRKVLRVSVPDGPAQTVQGFHWTVIAGKAPEKAAETTPAKAWPVAPKPGPLLAKVVYANDKVVEKCWVKVLNEGAWVVVDDTYCWFVRSAFNEITLLNEEPSDELKKSMEAAEAKRKAELERQRKADEARAKEKAEAAGEGKTAEKKTDAARGADLGVGGATATGPTQAAQGGGYLPGTGDMQRSSGGKNYGGGTGPGSGPGRRYVHHVRRYGLFYQWRVMKVDREKGLVTVRNRHTKQVLELEAIDPKSLAKVHNGEILVGTLDAAEPHLTTRDDSTRIDFDGLPEAVALPDNLDRMPVTP